MIDLRTLRDHTDTVTAAIRRKNPAFDPNALLAADAHKRALQDQYDTLRAKQNAANDAIAAAQGEDKATKISEMKHVAEETKKVEQDLRTAEAALTELLATVPNPPSIDTPDGGEDDFRIEQEVGTIPTFTFTPRPHEELGDILDIIDTERGVRCSGSRFYYLKNDAVLLELALAQYVLHYLVSKGFTPLITPQLVREQAMYATGFFPADRVNIYSVNPTTPDNPDGDDLFLIGTSEVPLTMYHAGEIIEVDQPLLYAGYSSCFRREAGTYGKDAKGIFRVHQFEKVEMYCFCKPEDSSRMHEFIRATEEEILKNLGIPYRVITIAAGDLGMPATKKYDIEGYIPSQATYRELTSASNCTDYQARRANIRYRTDKGTEFVHTLNGTACSMNRPIIAILENNQQEDGSILIPEVLRPYMGKDKIVPRSKA